MKTILFVTVLAAAALTAAITTPLANGIANNAPASAPSHIAAVDDPPPGCPWDPTQCVPPGPPNQQ